MIDYKVQHLEMIQGIVNRMAGNSFALKGWSVTLVTGILALGSREENKIYFLVVVIPILAFWVLDAYYLLQERKYRTIYNKVRMMEPDEIDFSMDTNVYECNTKRNSYWNCFKSFTEFGFYVSLASVTVCVILFMNN